MSVITVIHETIDSSLDLDDIDLSLLIALCILRDPLSFQDLGTINGEVWETWAFNGVTFEPSVYSGFSFNSYTVADGITYAAREEGIYILDGTKDGNDEISDGVILSPTMFGIHNRKRFRQGFFDVVGALPIVRGEVAGLSADMPIVHAKTMFPRALVGNKWTFLIADFDELGQIELFPVILTR